MRGSARAFLTSNVNKAFQNLTLHLLILLGCLPVLPSPLLLLHRVLLLLFEPLLVCLPQLRERQCVRGSERDRHRDNGCGSERERERETMRDCERVSVRMRMCVSLSLSLHVQPRVCASVCACVHVRQRVRAFMCACPPSTQAHTFFFIFFSFSGLASGGSKLATESSKIR